MPSVDVGGCPIHYEVQGAGDPVMLITGLGGVGRSWGRTIDLFAERYLTIIPDHRGTGASGTPDHGYTIARHAADMAAVLGDIGAGPTHVVGSSTGGAMAQVMALDHSDLVRSIVLADSWARPDDWFRHQFASRKRILRDSGVAAYTETSAQFLFGSTYFRNHYDEVRAWIDVAASSGTDPGIMAKRIEMIVAFDESHRLGDIDAPALVVVGDEDICTPPAASVELAGLIPGAELQTLTGGHLIYKEQPDRFFETVDRFLAGVGAQPR